MRRFTRKMGAILAACVMAAAAGAHGWAQAAGSPAESMHPGGTAVPSFEVATVKPSGSGSAGTNFGITPGRFSVESATVEELIQFAYDVKTNDGIAGGPAWTDTVKFDVAAKIADADAQAIEKLQPSQRIEPLRLMMQSLLAERFGLLTSTQTRELPVYALVVARSGPKLTPVEPGKQHAPMLWGGSRGDLHASSVSMALFADWISGSTDTGGRSVIDKTGLKGSYDFTLKWTRVESGFNAVGDPGTTQPAATAMDQAPGLFTALEEQLGLKLEPAKGPVKVIVIERIERPSPN